MFVCISLLLTIALLLLLFLSKKEIKIEHVDELPFVSVLVAARNEEDKIASCIEALLAQEYPKEKMEILIGDDDSDDDTARIVKGYTYKYPHVCYQHISTPLGDTKGKANVLAHLAQKAKGEYFLITDADIEVNPCWCKNMLFIAKAKACDIVTGVTTIKSRGWFSAFQKIDWLYFMSLIKAVTDLGLPLTSMGNNMLISKEAYEKTGGYAKIPFSVTEDLALFQAVIQNEGTYYHHFSIETLAYSQPIATFMHLLKQRKRWMRGAVQTPWYMVLLLLLQAFFYPVFCVTLWLNPSIAVFSVAVAKYVTQLGFICFYAHKIRQKPKIGLLLLYEVYSGFLSICLLMYYVMPTGIKWKGRVYK